MRKPIDLLSAADTLMAFPVTRRSGIHRRAAALLLRRALELAMREYWQQIRPELTTTRTRTQSLCLALRDHAGLAGRWSTLWMGLSQVCHYHRYPLPPTVAELDGWRSAATEVVSELERLSLGEAWTL